MLHTINKPLRCPSLAAACRRSASSKAKKFSHHDQKMEALVSLYHQSSNFITPENLSAVIDQAFTQPTTVLDDRKMHSFSGLFKMRGRHRSLPKFFLGRDTSPFERSSENMGPGWTESKSKRVERVYQTLMGTQPDGRPSWLGLKENSERVMSEIEKDKQGRAK